MANPLWPDKRAAFYTRASHSQQATLRHRHGVAGRDDDVIEHTYIDELQHVAQSFRDLDVADTRLSDPRRMVVHEDQSGSIQRERFPQDLARMHRRAIER